MRGKRFLLWRPSNIGSVKQTYLCCRKRTSGSIIASSSRIVGSKTGTSSDSYFLPFLRTRYLIAFLQAAERVCRLVMRRACLDRGEQARNGGQSVHAPAELPRIVPAPMFRAAAARSDTLRHGC